MESDGESTNLVAVEPRPLPALKIRRPAGTIVAAAGENAMRRFLEFFAVTIDNKNTATL